MRADHVLNITVTGFPLSISIEQPSSSTGGASIKYSHQLVNTKEASLTTVVSALTARLLRTATSVNTVQRTDNKWTISYTGLIRSSGLTTLIREVVRTL